MALDANISVWVALRATLVRDLDVEHMDAWLCATKHNETVGQRRTRIRLAGYEARVFTGPDDEFPDTRATGATGKRSQSVHL